LADRSASVSEVTRLDNFVLSSLPVATPILSQFEGGTEGWTVSTKNMGANFATLEPAEDLLGFNIAGGNAGAYIEAVDGVESSWFVAPEKYLGDQSGMLGGRLEYATRQLSGTNLAVGTDHEVALVGKDITLVAELDSNNTVGSTWERVAVDLNAEDWLIDGTSTAPTQAQLLAVLSDLNGLYIRAEYRFGTDNVGLDEVRLAPASEGIDAKVLETAVQSLTDDPVPELQGRIEVDVAAGTVTRFDTNDVEIAQDTFAGIETIFGGTQGDIFTADLAEDLSLIHISEPTRPD